MIYQADIFIQTRKLLRLISLADQATELQFSLAQEQN